MRKFNAKFSNALYFQFLKRKLFQSIKLFLKKKWQSMIFTHIKWCLRYRFTQYPSRFSGIRGPGAVYPYWRVRLLTIYPYLFTGKRAIVFWSFSRSQFRSSLRFCYRNVWRLTSTSDVRFCATGFSTSVREWYSGSRFLLVESSIKCPDKVKDEEKVEVSWMCFFPFSSCPEETPAKY